MPSLLCSNSYVPKPGSDQSIHDVHSHLSGMNEVDLARRLQPYQMFCGRHPSARIYSLLPQHP